MEFASLMGQEHENQSSEDLAPLLRAAAAGSDAAWREVVSRYARRVFALARSRCRDSNVAEEITQSVFATIALKMGGGEYTELGRFESWLFRVAANRIRDYIRRLKHRPESGRTDLLDARASADRRETETDEVVRLRNAMESLTESDREVVELRHHGGLSFKQMADVLSEPVGTLLARHHRALRKLRDILGAAGEGKFGEGAAATVPGVGRVGAPPVTRIKGGQTS